VRIVPESAKRTPPIRAIQRGDGTLKFHMENTSRPFPEPRSLLTCIMVKHGAVRNSIAETESRSIDSAFIASTNHPVIIVLQLRGSRHLTVSQTYELDRINW